MRSQYFRERTVVDVFPLVSRMRTSVLPVTNRQMSVNVTVGVVAVRTLAQPDIVFLRRDIFGTFRCMPRVRPGFEPGFGVQITFLGGEQRPATVILDATSLR